MINIEICLGSSCFARGNSDALELLEGYIAGRKLSDRVRLTGSLCMNNCACGPHLSMNGVRHELKAPEGALEILESVLEGNGSGGQS